MTFTVPTFELHFREYNFDVKQDIETYIDWDVDTDITVDIDKDIDVDIDVDTDVKDNAAILTATIKDIGDNADNLVAISTNFAIEDVMSTSTLQAQSANTLVDLTAYASDKADAGYGGHFDSGTFTEISLGIDNVVGEFSILTLSMEALVDG